jgi:hypothetical protein
MGRSTIKASEEMVRLLQQKEEAIKTKVMAMVQARTKGIIDFSKVKIRWNIPMDNGWSYEQTANWIIDGVITSLTTSTEDNNNGKRSW